jgi:hypothetical protein
VDLTHAWPARVGARSIQRTAMVLRRDEALRLVDAFDLEKASMVTFRFITPQKPEMIKPDGSTPAGVRLGPVVLTWEGDMRCDIVALDERFALDEAEGATLHCVALTPTSPVDAASSRFISHGQAFKGPVSPLSLKTQSR